MFRAILLVGSLVCAATGLLAQEAPQPTVKQDVKAAGKNIGHAAKNVGHKVKRGAKEVGHGVKKAVDPE